MLGLFSGVINKVRGKQQETESLWFTGNGWRVPQGNITTASCLKKYHKDQANLPHHSHLEQLRGVHGKWKRPEPNQYRCNSLQLPASSLLHNAVVSLYPQFNIRPPLTKVPSSGPCHLFHWRWKCARWVGIITPLRWVLFQLMNLFFSFTVYYKQEKYIGEGC